MNEVSEISNLHFLLGPVCFCFLFKDHICRQMVKNIIFYAKPIFGWMLRIVSPSPASPHWPANELFPTLRAPIGRRDDLFRQVPPGHPRPIGRRTNCFRRSIFGLEQYLKTAIFHTIFTHCWLSIVSDFIRAFCFRVFLLFFNIDHLFRANVSQPILHVLMLYLSWFWKR